MEPKRVERPEGEDEKGSERRRRQLIGAAFASVVEHGLASTTRAIVARASDLSQGAAVFHFKTREMLRSGAFRYRTEAHRAANLTAVEAAGDGPADKLVAMILAARDPNRLMRDNHAFRNAVWPRTARKTQIMAFAKAPTGEIT